MARTLNKVQLIGHLGQNPEIRKMPNGESVAAFSVATNERWTDKSTGEEKERIDWHQITAFKGLADIAGKYLKKGSHVFLTGAIRYDKWEDVNSGETRYSTKIIASDLIMLDKQQQMPIADNHPEANAGKPESVPNLASVDNGADVELDVEF